MNSHRIRHSLYSFNDLGNIVKAKALVKLILDETVD